MTPTDRSEELNPDIIITKTGLNRFGPMFILFFIFQKSKGDFDKADGLVPARATRAMTVSHGSFAHNRPIYGKRVRKYWIRTNTVFLREVWVRYDVRATWCSLLSVQHQPLSLFLSLPSYYSWGFVSLWTIPLLPFSPENVVQKSLICLDRSKIKTTPGSILRLLPICFWMPACWWWTTKQFKWPLMIIKEYMCFLWSFMGFERTMV